MNKEATNYLKKLLTEFEPYIISSEDQKKIDRDKVLFITEKLTRKKFRRQALSASTKQAILEKVKISVAEERPLHFVVPFGGYKHFWNPSHPEPDWAELFNFKYLSEYVSPALACHKPGVIIEYMAEDMILTRMNNYPKEALETYAKVFKEIINWYDKQTPSNLMFRYFRVGDKCNSQKIIGIIEDLIPSRREAFEKLSQEEKDRELHRSKRSIFWNGEHDLSKLTETDKLNRMITSRLIELAYYETEAQPEFMGNYLGEDNHICICFSFGTTHDNDEYQDLTLGSTYGSLVDHWIGRGILVKTNEGFSPRIISRKQYEEAKDKLEVVAVDNIPPYKNYNSIEVLTA